MPNESAGSSLISTVTRLIDNNMNEGAGLDNLVTVLSLLCLMCVFTRQHGATSPAAAPKDTTALGQVNKIIGDLTKGDGTSSGGGADALMSLLPLLNNPQLKSKLNPATLATVFGMLNNMGGKQDPPKEKEKPSSKAQEPSPEETESSPEETPIPSDDPEDQENKSLGRYLNWKTNF